MAHPRCVAILCVSVIILLAGIAFSRAQEPDMCPTLRKHLALKRQHLAQHVDALKKLCDQNEYVIMAVFNEKIREIIEDIRRTEDSLRHCPHEEPAPQSSGLDRVKSDTSEHANKSCDELRTLFLQFLQKIASLKRREGSVFSSLTPTEKNELEEAERSLKELKATIKSKCPTPNDHGPPRRRQR